MQTYFATCARGLEPVLVEELVALRARDVQAGRGGVHFHGERELLYRANLWLRTAVRVLMPIMNAPVTSPDELYDAVRSLDWSQYLTPDHTLAVDCNVRDSHITHSHYAALKTKDAVCDQFVEKTGRRPSVDTETPMVGLNLHIYRDEAVLSLDSSGESLHKRGYRDKLYKAPLNEALAAGLIHMTGWRGDVPLVDPLCGSGTIPIEAAWIATKRPPGLTRRRFAFQGWMDFDVAEWTAIRDEARAQVGKLLGAPIEGFDQRRDAIAFAEQAARSAGVYHLLKFTQRDVAEFQPPTDVPGIVLCNPPYGERIGERHQVEALYRMMSKTFLERCKGWKIFVFTGNPSAVRLLNVQPETDIKLFNGRIPCRLLGWTIE